MFALMACVCLCVCMLYRPVYSGREMRGLRVKRGKKQRALSFVPRLYSPGLYRAD